MTATFSTSESASLYRDVDLDPSSSTIQLADIWTQQRLEECQQWILRNDYKKVCLQFPDNLLEFSAHIAHQLKEAVGTSGADVFILGDTSYGSCCVDEVAASHINADAIVHFGHACLSKVIRLPLLYVFPNFQIDADRLSEQIAAQLKPRSDESLMVFYNVGFHYQLSHIKSRLAAAGLTNINYGELALNTEPDNLCWKLGESGNDLNDVTCIYVGRDDQTLFNLTLSISAKQWFLFDAHRNPSATLTPITPSTSTWMRRRNFYIEKCKDARTLGIVVGTLTAKGYLDLVKHIQSLARHRYIRTYLISVGKVNPAKLANFMEIDCFVLIGCPENNLFTSRDFYKPLLSVFEVEMALNVAWTGELAPNYSVDFRDILPAGRLHREYAGLAAVENDVSLVTGRIRFGQNEEETMLGDGDGSHALVERKNHQLMSVESSGSLQNRSWAGLDPQLGKTEAVRVEDGRSGLAIKYTENAA